jgi:small subunit ribosomal protein S17
MLIYRKVKHEMYGKYMSVSKKYHAHAESAYNEGDLIEIQEGRPISIRVYVFLLPQLP